MQKVATQAKRNPEASPRKIATLLQEQANSSVSPSRSSVQLAMKRKNLKRCRKPRVPFLSDEQKAARLKYALDHQNLDWKSVIYTDETFITLDGSMSGWWTGKKGQRCPRRFRHFSRRPGSQGAMFWGAIWWNGHSELVYIPTPMIAYWDKDGKKRWKRKGMDQFDYNDLILSAELRRAHARVKANWRGYGSVSILEDGAKLHHTPLCKKTKKRHNMISLPHPANSPDLNPIEHEWATLKRRVYGTRPRKDSVLRLIKRAQRLWKGIPQKEINNCILAMFDRIPLVIEHTGDNTFK